MGVNVSRVLELAIPCLLLWGILAASLALDRSRFRKNRYGADQNLQQFKYKAIQIILIPADQFHAILIVEHMPGNRIDEHPAAPEISVVPDIAFHNAENGHLVHFVQPPRLSRAILRISMGFRLTGDAVRIRAS